MVGLPSFVRFGDWVANIDKAMETNAAIKQDPQLTAVGFGPAPLRTGAYSSALDHLAILLRKLEHSPINDNLK